MKFTTEQAVNLADKLEKKEIQLGNDLGMIMATKSAKCSECGEVRLFNSAEGLRCIAWLHEGHTLEVA